MFVLKDVRSGFNHSLKREPQLCTIMYTYNIGRVSICSAHIQVSKKNVEKKQEYCELCASWPSNQTALFLLLLQKVSKHNKQ